jgi:hypothetical protein
MAFIIYLMIKVLSYNIILVEVNDIIEILKYVCMGRLLLIPCCYLSLKSMRYCLRKQMEFNCIQIHMFKT